MHKTSIFRTILVTLVVLLWTTGAVMASPPAQEPSDEVSIQAAVTTAFTYQGNLKDGSGPANGSYDFEFGLFDAVSGGNGVGLTLTRLNQTVTDGLFSVALDFGNQFDGTALWLQINVRTAGNVQNGYTPLSPRQPLTAAPYAIFSIAPWVTSGSNLSYNAGNVGIGTTTPPARKLTVQTPTDAYGIEHTDGVVRLSTFVFNTGGSNPGDGGYLGTFSNHNLHFYTNDSTPQMTVATSGNVGIGDFNPTKGKLVVEGTAGNFALSTFGAYGSTNAVYSTAANNTGPNSIWASGRVTALDYIAFSDERMKHIEGRSDAAQDLSTLLGIEVTDYTYIDTVTKGVGEQKKVIAQQVETIYPQAVSRSTDVVPDIYQKAPIKAGWVELATDLQVGERVRLIGEKSEGIYEVLAVTQDRFRTNFVADGKAVFVYGREVKDFRSVDYEAIAMLNVSATQALNRLVAQQATEIESLTTRLAALEQAVNSDNTTSRAESSAPLMPWLLFGGLGIVSLAVVQQRRAG